MDKERVQQIRELGDRLASYVNVENDRKFFMRFYEERNYEVFRNSLMRANLNWVRHGHDPLIMLEPYIKVFEEGDNSSRPDWRLSRDLVLMRMIEQLYQHGWLGKHPEVIPEEREDETPAES